jgi:hypothetical protein
MFRRPYLKVTPDSEGDSAAVALFRSVEMASWPGTGRALSDRGEWFSFQSPFVGLNEDNQPACNPVGELA